MSEFINNREHRQKVLRDIIHQLHEGKTVEEVRAVFEETFSGVSAREITEAEQALILSGTKVEEIQSLCDVHAAVFKGSIEEIHNPTEPEKIPGHPINTLFRENRALRSLMEKIQGNTDPNILRKDFLQLLSIDTHYKKKENLLFPYMEKYGITAPPQVMWGVDDEIRTQLKDCNARIQAADALSPELKGDIDTALDRVREMIFKEESIMIPMLMENLTEAEWYAIEGDTEEFGYCLIHKPSHWNPDKNPTGSPKGETSGDDGIKEGTVVLPSGRFTIEELTRVFNTLPVDITFVDRKDQVKFFSETPDRVFPRARSIIGREVKNCHPPASVHIVEGIVADFRSGKKDGEDFWIRMGEKLILIRYFALRDEAGDYMGTLEVTQEIAGIQALTGEKRLVSMA